MTTVSYALRRLGASALLLLLLTFLTFSLYKAIPANPAGFLVDMQKATPDQIAKAEAALHLHDPFYKQYGDYLWRLAHGDLGIAYQGTTLTPDGSRVGTPVGPAVVRATLVTGALVIGGALLALLISIPLGAIAAAKPRSATDRTILAVSLVGICTHPLVVALLLQQFPGNRWGIAPARGYCPFFGTAGEPGKFDGFSLSQDLGCAGPTAWASHLILPWITFSLFFVAIYTRLVRVRMFEVMDEPYIRMAEAKGMPRARVIRHHALRNAMSPVLKLVGMDIGLALGIALYVESVYRLPGLGLTTLSALNGDTGFDLPMILGVVLVIGLVIVVANFIIDLVVAWMDLGLGRHPQLGRRPRRLTVRHRLRGVRILLVSQMYPGRDTPDLGSFVATMEEALTGRGHEVARAVVDTRGGRRRHAGLAANVLRTARTFRPDVVYAHFLVPAGLLAALAGHAPLVVTAHGQDVENARRSRATRSATVFTVRRAHAVVAVSAWLLARLVEVVPEAQAKSSVIDMGVDLKRFSLRDAGEARAAVGWSPAGTGFLCLGSLSERKNVLRLARAFEQRGEGELAFVGDGPLRSALEGRPGIHIAGAVEHDEVATWLAAADVVCQPSLMEPFGLSTLEGLASGRSVVATRVGGPPEFVPAGAGVLVDPTDDDSVRAGLEEAALLPRPNLDARGAAEAHDVRRQAERVEELLVRAAASRDPRA